MILFCFGFCLEAISQEDLLFVCVLCILLHEMHACLGVVPMIQSGSPCPFGSGSVHSPADPRERGKG